MLVRLVAPANELHIGLLPSSWFTRMQSTYMLKSGGPPIGNASAAIVSSASLARFLGRQVLSRGDCGTELREPRAPCLVSCMTYSAVSLRSPAKPCADNCVRDPPMSLLYHKQHDLEVRTRGLYSLLCQFSGYNSPGSVQCFEARQSYKGGRMNSAQSGCSDEVPGATVSLWKRGNRGVHTNSSHCSLAAGMLSLQSSPIAVAVVACHFVVNRGIRSHDSRLTEWSNAEHR